MIGPLPNRKMQTHFPLFEDDLQRRQETTVLFLQAQAQPGLGHKSAAKKLLATVLVRDPNHALAAELAEGLEKRG